MDCEQKWSYLMEEFRSPLLAGDVRWFPQLEALGATLCGFITDREVVLSALGLLVAAQGASLAMGTTHLAEPQVLYAVAPGADPEQVKRAANALVDAGIWRKTEFGYDLGVGPLIRLREDQAEMRREKARRGGLARANNARAADAEAKNKAASQGEEEPF
jgi:hypothetical protein